MNALAAVLGPETGVLPVKRLAATAALGSAAFGAAVGCYVGGWQIVFAAVKMPIFLLGTLAISMAAMAVLAAGSMAPRESMQVALRSVSTTAIVLGSLAPPLALAGLSMPRPDPRAYNAMVSLLTLAVGAGGIAGVVRLRARLPSRRLLAAWIGIYGFVGAQMAWLLKPWVGHTLKADRFIPLAENLKGNFYEAAWGSLLRAVLGGTP